MSTDPVIIVGLPVKDRAWCLPYWLECLDRQKVDFDVLAYYTPGEDNTEQILIDYGAKIIYDTEPGRPLRDITNHLWNGKGQFEYMSNLRNKMLETVQASGADYFFSLDSDVMIPENALEKLIAFSSSHPGIVAPNMNMSGRGWAPNRMLWTHGDRPRVTDAKRPSNWFPDTGKADVVMAAMLFDRDAMRARWCPHEQGEDVGLCLDAEAKQINRWWIAEILCEHWMYQT